MIDKLFLEHVGLPHVLDIAAHLSPLWIKVRVCWGGVGWVVAHVILVSAQVLLVLTFGLWTLDFGLGLDNSKIN